MQIIAELRRYLSAGWKHRWLALGIAWLICVPGWIGVQMLPSQYQSSARLYADADAVLGALLRGIAIDSSPAAQVEVLQRTLLSRPNIERIVARTNLDMRVVSVADREKLLNELARSIKISVQSRNLFSVTYTDRDPRLARDVVQAVLNLFIEQATVTDRQQMENAQSFVTQQIATYEAQLREAEQRRADFRSRYVDLLPDGTTGVTGLEAARTRQLRLKGELEDVRQSRAILQQQLTTTPAMVSSAEVGGGDGQLAEAERALRDLRLRFTESHPDVMAARNALAQLRSTGGGGAAGPRSSAVRNPLYEALRLRSVDAETQIRSLERQIRDEQGLIDRLEALARTMPQLQAEFQNLDRDYSVMRKNYDELLARREALQLAGAARTGAERVRLEVVDPPVLPTAPSGPKRLLFSLGVLLAGLGAGVAMAFVMVQLDRSFYTVHDLRKLGLPVLGAVSVARPSPVPMFRIAAFVTSLGLLFVAFGAAVVGGQTIIARLPSLLARFTA